METHRHTTPLLDPPPPVQNQLLAHVWGVLGTCVFEVGTARVKQVSLHLVDRSQLIFNNLR